MATYAELHALKDDSGLLEKVEVACWVAAESIRTEDAGVPNHANRLLWAKHVFENPTGVANDLLPIMLASNKDVAVAAITGATDAQIQAKVDQSIDLFATG